MTESDLPEAVNTLISSEINRMREDYARSVGSTMLELACICGSGGLASENLPAFAKKDAITTVQTEVFQFWNKSMDEGFGICFNGWNLEDSKIDPSLLPVISKALRAALLSAGIETDDDVDFVRFADDDHKARLEARILKSALDERMKDVKKIKGDIDCLIASLTKKAEEAEAKARALDDEKAEAFKRRAVYETEIFNIVRILGKRSRPDESEPKRARVGEVVNVDA